VLIAALFSVLGTSLAVTRKPSDIKLQWLNSGKGMKITFPDKTTDEIELQADPQNECFYHGHLMEDHESQVEVDGCKGDLEIIEISSRLVPCGLVFLLLENGETYEIDPTEGLQFPNQTDSVVPEVAGGQIAAMNGQLPTSVEAKIHVRYDPSFRDLYGSDSAAKRKIRDIISLAQPWFKRERNLAMNIEIKVVTNQYYPRRIGFPNHSIRGLIGKGGSREHPTAFFKAADPANRGMAYGVAYRDAFCFRSGSAQGMGLITEVFKGTENDASSAILFAHELGHNLGMKHDFHEDHGGPGDNNGEHYGPCNDQGIMSYSPPQLPRQWSRCSRGDQERHYRERGHQCMTIGGGGGGNGGSSCRCNGEDVAWKNQRIGSCDDGTSISCGNWCFVGPSCTQKFWMSWAGKWVSCTPCDNTRSPPPLKTAECSVSGSPDAIGLSVGLLAAGFLVALI